MVHGAIIRFFKLEAAGGVLLVIAAIIAILLENSPAQKGLHLLLEYEILAGFSVHHFINDALMALFFLVVGIEIKREVVQGELSTISQAMLPAAAAVGGMIAPACVYLFITRSYPVYQHGWGIPVATDIAFSLAALSFVSTRVPLSLKIFLTTLAVVDDLLAIVVIALFYGAGLSFTPLFTAVALAVALCLLNYLGCKRLFPFLIVGLALLVAVYLSGIHATIAGVILGFALPLTVLPLSQHPERKKPRGEVSLAGQVETFLHPYVSFLIMPLFALANAGINIQGFSFALLMHPVTLAIAFGLCLGKQIGITGACYLLVRSGLATLPRGATWMHIYGVSLLAGVGFTMSLFIALLAFARSPEILNEARLGVVIGSLLSVTLGIIILKLARPTHSQRKQSIL